MFNIKDGRVEFSKTCIFDILDVFFISVLESIVKLLFALDVKQKTKVNNHLIIKSPNCMDLSWIRKKERKKRRKNSVVLYQKK
jgi:hypothetical protein